MEWIKGLLKRGLVTALTIGLVLAGLFVIAQPGYADAPADKLPAEDTLERAYDAFSRNTAQREEIFLDRVEAGEDPETLPRPFKRVKSLDGKEVPQTSLVEKAASKAQELFEDKTDK